MNAISYHFGLGGQPAADFDSFLCGKRCRSRRAGRRKLREERRSLKNDERRAEIERLRAETNVVQSNMAASPTQAAPTPSNVATMASAPLPVVKAAVSPLTNSSPPPPVKRSNLPLIAGSALAFGGLIYLIVRLRNT